VGWFFSRSRIDLAEQLTAETADNASRFLEGLAELRDRLGVDFGNYPVPHEVVYFALTLTTYSVFRWGRGDPEALSDKVALADSAPPARVQSSPRTIREGVDRTVRRAN
jgi:hypothetical protein